MRVQKVDVFWKPSNYSFCFFQKSESIISKFFEMVFVIIDTFGPFGQHVETNGTTTGTFPKDRYSIWITSKRSYVVLHPLED